MRTDRKARVQTLADDLQRSPNPDAQAVKELLGLKLDEAKDSLLTERGEDLIRAQGAAIAIEKLLSLVTRPVQPLQGASK